MLLVDLAALNEQQLRRLLAGARARGEDELEDHVLGELVRRGLEAPVGAERPARRVQSREEPEPPVYAGDATEEPERPEDSVQAPVEPERPAPDKPAPDELQIQFPRLAKAMVTEPPPPPPDRSGWTALAIVAAVGVAAAGGAGWMLTRSGRPPAPAAATEPPAANLAEARLPASPGARPVDCSAPANAADRMVCRRPSLLARDRALWKTYYRVRDAAADQAPLRHAQVAWWRARNRASSPARLEALYDRRMRELQGGRPHRRAQHERTGKAAHVPERTPPPQT